MAGRRAVAVAAVVLGATAVLAVARPAGRQRLRGLPAAVVAAYRQREGELRAALLPSPIEVDEARAHRRAAVDSAGAGAAVDSAGAAGPTGTADLAAPAAVGPRTEDDDLAETFS
ncbi:hypothetical protein MF406_09420 [Georgenia sp. TF02-10]|uniref:hypothetical protein n=1 Tax=Georgenia sp. TF02-10 TaxID=2917725 RepID=UPI001FA78AEF|nr:hypothetical protein [Georgenia sp. TF02-10]UNX53248.1 hypothetical protein MF406_09420 [Georgenia sp. TF02-10]